MNDTTKKTQGRPRVADLRATFSLRVRQSVIDRLPEFGGRAGAGDMIEACVTGCTPPNASNILVLPEETMKLLREKAEVADCPVATLLEAAIKMFDITPFEAARREAQALMDRALGLKANALTMLNREVVDTLPQAPIPTPVAAPTLPQLPQFQPVQPVQPVAPVDEDDFADDDPDFERKQFAKYARLADRGYNPFAAPTSAPATETKPLPTMNFRFGGN